MSLATHTVGDGGGHAPSRAVGSAPAVEVAGVSKVYQSRDGRHIRRTRALNDVNLVVSAREFVAIIGPSGCGKSTLLRVIAGLIEATTGRVAIRGRPVHGPSSDTAMVFQSPGLMPWLTVLRNLLLALEFGGVPKADRLDRAKRCLELVGLWEFRDHYPAELSGGMQQRVGLARALSAEPEVLLMDEPFGALDAITRERMQAELLQIWEYQPRPVFFVTHSIDEALVLADRIIVMRDGTVTESFPTPFPRPRSRGDLLRNDEAIRIRAAVVARLMGS